MAKTSGQVDPLDYPVGMRNQFARTQTKTIWDAGATAFDLAKTTWDAGRLGAKYTRRKVVHQNPLAPTWQAATTWDAQATAWDASITQWDLYKTGEAPTTHYGQHQALHAAYGLQHDTLGGWKRMRWNICGIARGMTGRNLYLQCCYQQNTPLGNHPVSPCSRRVLDPLASPFDWTP